MAGCSVWALICKARTGVSDGRFAGRNRVEPVKANARARGIGQSDDPQRPYRSRRGVRSHANIFATKGIKKSFMRAREGGRICRAGLVKGIKRGRMGDKPGLFFRAGPGMFPDLGGEAEKMYPAGGTFPPKFSAGTKNKKHGLMVRETPSYKKRKKKVADVALVVQIRRSEADTVVGRVCCRCL